MNSRANLNNNFHNLSVLCSKIHFCRPLYRKSSKYLYSGSGFLGFCHSFQHSCTPNRTKSCTALCNNSHFGRAVGKFSGQSGNLPDHRRYRFLDSLRLLVIDGVAEENAKEMTRQDVGGRVGET